MGWTTPRDWTYELATSAKMDEVSDDLSWLGGNATTRSKGRPHCRVQCPTFSTSTSGSWVALSAGGGVGFNTSVGSDPTTYAPLIDVGSMWVNGASYITIPNAGFWLVSAYTKCTSTNNDGVRGIAISSAASGGGTIYAAATAPAMTTASTNPSMCASTLVQLSAGSLHCSVLHSAGAVSITFAPVIFSAIYMMV